MAKILLVEDNEETRDSMTIWLELADHTVVVAKDGQEALERVSDPRPDLIITDLAMPRMDGIELIKTIRQHEIQPWSTPILALTGYYVEMASRAVEAGANRVLVKPSDPDTILANVKNLLTAHIQSP